MSSITLKTEVNTGRAEPSKLKKVTDDFVPGYLSTKVVWALHQNKKFNHELAGMFDMRLMNPKLLPAFYTISK